MGLAIILSHTNHSTGIDIYLGSATTVMLNIPTIDRNKTPLLDKLLDAAVSEQSLWINGIHILDFIVELESVNQLIGTPKTHILRVAQHKLVEFFQVNHILEWKLTIA